MEWPALPQSLVLYGQPYSVEIVADLAASSHRYGETRYYTHTISIDGGSVLSVQWATLCHEVLHVIDEHLALGLEEEDVRRLDSGLFEFISQLGIGGTCK
jgi:hypothetical protein